MKVFVVTIWRSSNWPIPASVLMEGVFSTRHKAARFVAELRRQCPPGTPHGVERYLIEGVTVDEP